jgi:phospholipid/cholesterol/gamma-HCH transport system permease protein
MLRVVTYIGSTAIRLCAALGGFVLFFLRALTTLSTTRLNVTQLFLHMKQVGVDSLMIIVLTGFSVGLALALQTNIGLSRFGTNEFIGVIVALGMARELGPVLTGLMVTGRAGSAMAAEIGTMRITEQIDALRTLGINPFQYLIVPRMIASALILPFLTIFSVISGVVGGYILCVYKLEMNPEAYISGIQQFVELSDLNGGLIKSSCFGIILAWVGTYNGYHTVGGARGVGISTTRSVVLASIMILITNYFLSAFLNQVGIS